MSPSRRSTVAELLNRVVVQCARSGGGAEMRVDDVCKSVRYVYTRVVPWNELLTMHMF